MMIAATDVNKAVQPAKGDRDLLRIFSLSELRKAFRENGGSALVVPLSTSRPRLPACTTNSTLLCFLPRLRQAPSSRPTSPATAASWCRWWCYSASSGTFSPTTSWSNKQSERNGFRGISDEEDGEVCRKKLKLSEDQSAISATSSPTLPHQ